MEDTSKKGNTDRADFMFKVIKDADNILSQEKNILGKWLRCQYLKKRITKEIKDIEDEVLNALYAEKGHTIEQGYHISLKDVKKIETEKFE